jgi:hypothetical protein
MKTASEEVTEMIFLSKWSSQTLCAGAELGIFDSLSRDGTRTASEVAAETGFDSMLLYRLLRALASLGLLNETPGRRFNVTERGALLRTDAPARCATWPCWRVAQSIGRSGSMCPRMVKDGRQNAFLREYGEMAFDHARANPEGYGAVFDRAMSDFSAIQSAWALEALRNCDFSSVATWCDVGGGSRPHDVLLPSDGPGTTCSTMKMRPSGLRGCFELDSLTRVHCWLICQTQNVLPNDWRAKDYICRLGE